ncbi:Chromosome alignment-maintaining phosphoprotein 1, partial [Lasiodiplodia theobromae]|uniref:Chromosome alignment-maintaining phosphoprotein 1 n=1 Tax=Lasiodiplodia theobromae TaxID=45133 RepID=UPI0015C40881
MPVPAGLEQFGTLDWEEEYENLVSTGSTTKDDLDAGDAMCTMDISTKTTESELFFLEGDFDTNPDIVESYQLAPTNEVISAEDTIMEHTIHPASPVPLPLEEEHSHNSSAGQIFHPGWSEETPSWDPDTATSPQVARWAVSPGIFKDIKWTINACRDDVADNNIPRIASSLLRAVQHVYKVPLDAGIGYPCGARGEKFYKRWLGPIHLFPRGAMGLKEPNEPDVPKDVYVPNGIKILPPSPHGQAFYPRPSPLRYVANNDDDQPPKPSQSAPSLVFFSGENYLDVDVEMSQSMETGEITIQKYEQESDQDAGEEIEFSPKAPIETQFEIEINDRTVPSNIVDQDDEHLSASSEGSCSWPSSPPLPSRELDSPVIIYDDETVGLVSDETACDLPELALAAHYKIPELGLAQDLDSAPLYSAYHA